MLVTTIWFGFLSIFSIILVVPICGKKKTDANKRDAMPVSKRELEQRKEISKAQAAAAKDQKATEASNMKENNQQATPSNAPTSQVKEKEAGGGVVSNPIVSLVTEAATGDAKK